MFVATWFARAVEGESKDDKKCRTLNVIHLLREHGDPELWREVAGQLGISDELDLSGVLTKDDLVDVKYLMSSGEASNVTTLM